MASSLARALHLASVVICLIAVASFTLFVVNQTSSASTRQQEVLNEGAPAPTAIPAAAGSTNASRQHKSSLRKTIDDASSALTSPFSGITAGSTSQWVIRGGNLLLALAVYGFGLGFLARVVRVRV